MTEPAFAAATRCRHCGYRVDSLADFCCRGCEVAHRIIAGAGLETFYELRGEVGAGPPKTAPFERARERLWLEELEATIGNADDVISIEIGISGLFCAACVWLIERTARGRAGLAEIVINSARATAVLLVTRVFDVQAFAAELEKLGYRVVPAKSESRDPDDGLLARTGIAAALALNSMLLSASLYLGLEAGWLHRLFVGLSALLAAGSLVLGGQVFGRRALAALRARTVSLDVPIVIGIAAVFASSVWGAASGRSSAIYFDSLSVFVALMLGGRLLQERLLRANRERIAASDRQLDLGARLIRDGRVQSVTAASLAVGDRVLVPPGEVVPTDITLDDERAGCRLDWITGESAPRLFRAGETIPGGAINESRTALSGTVASPLADTGLPDLLATPSSVGADGATATSAAIAASYVVVVLSIAAVGFVGWLAATADFARALEVTAAVLVVTCPCALGVGAPLAFELTAARLAKAGAFIRTPDALAKLATVTHVAFDKTGTVTEARLVVSNPAVFELLAADERHVLYNLAARSGHPHSAAITAALPGTLDSAINSIEVAGAGASTTWSGATFRLGRQDWARGANTSRDTVFARDGVVLAAPVLVEKLRDDAASELRCLVAAGYRISLVSGDCAGRVAEVAGRLGIPTEQVVAEASPEDKARWVTATDTGDLLFVGDGLNDAPALERATVSATPSFESPLIADRVDLYFAGRGIGPIRLALSAARALVNIQRRLLLFVVTYNALVVALALAGWMKPWLAAVLMPTSSLAVTALTSIAVYKGSAWKSSPS